MSLAQAGPPAADGQDEIWLSIRCYTDTQAGLDPDAVIGSIEALVDVVSLAYLLADTSINVVEGNAGDLLTAPWSSDIPPTGPGEFLDVIRERRMVIEFVSYENPVVEHFLIKIIGEAADGIVRIITGIASAPVEILLRIDERRWLKQKRIKDLEMLDLELEARRLEGRVSEAEAEYRIATFNAAREEVERSALVARQDQAAAGVPVSRVPDRAISQAVNDARVVNGVQAIQDSGLRLDVSGTTGPAG
jgi:hypothetical protein